MISFYAKWAIEADYDFVQFQVSTDGGTTWIGQCGNYTVPGTSANGSVQPNNQPVYEGTQSTWVLEEVNLSDYLGQQILLYQGMFVIFFQAQHKALMHLQKGYLQ